MMIPVCLLHSSSSDRLLNAIVACLLLLTAGCFAAPVEKEQSEPIGKQQRLPLSQRKLEQLDGAIKLLAGPEYSLDDFSMHAQLFFWKVSKLDEIDGEYEWIQRKLGLLMEDSEEAFLHRLDQHALLAFLDLPRETQSELESAMPSLKELQDVKGVQKIMGDICSAKTGDDAELGFEEDSEEPASPEEL